MWKYAIPVSLILLAWGQIGWALEPSEILVLADPDNAASARLARYYCEKRGIPSNHVFKVALGTPLRDTIGRGGLRPLAGRAAAPRPAIAPGPCGHPVYRDHLRDSVPRGTATAADRV